MDINARSFKKDPALVLVQVVPRSNELAAWTSTKTL
jgi:hypothetical protein